MPIFGYNLREFPAGDWKVPYRGRNSIGQNRVRQQLIQPGRTFAYAPGFCQKWRPIMGFEAHFGVSRLGAMLPQMRGELPIIYRARNDKAAALQAQRALQFTGATPTRPALTE